MDSRLTDAVEAIDEQIQKLEATKKALSEVGVLSSPPKRKSSGNRTGTKYGAGARHERRECKRLGCVRRFISHHNGHVYCENRKCRSLRGTSRKKQSDTQGNAKARKALTRGLRASQGPSAGARAARDKGTTLIKGAK